MKNYKIIVALALLLIILSTTACGMSENNSIEKMNVEEKSVPKTPVTERVVQDNVLLEGEDVGNLKESEIIRKLNMYAQKFDIPVREAKFDDETWDIVQKEHAGRRVNVEKTMEAIFSARPGERTKINVERVLPKTKAKTLDRNIILISRYTTRILDQKDARLNNIHLAAERLDLEKIGPGEEFSFNDVLGKRTVKKGYEKAPIIIKTEKGPKKTYGVGGGICQLSSTLFNAVDKLDMNITERHSHSKPVGYVPKGRDAMVAYGSSDFKFINNRNYPIMIRVYIRSNRLTVKIYENRNSYNSTV